MQDKKSKETSSRSRWTIFMRRENSREEVVLSFEEKTKLGHISIANIWYVRGKGCSCNSNRTDTKCRGNSRLMQRTVRH